MFDTNDSAKFAGLPKRMDSQDSINGRQTPRPDTEFLSTVQASRETSRYLEGNPVEVQWHSLSKEPMALSPRFQNDYGSRSEIHYVC